MRRLARFGSLSALALVIAALDPLPASACSCVSPRLQRTVLPADGASAFPTDGTIRVFLTGGFRAPLRSALAGEYRLRDPSGALVPLDARVTGTRLDLRPRAPLSPNARYALESVFAYDAAGVQVSDTERWASARRNTGGSLRGAWFPVAFFETDTGPSPRRTVTPQITSARVHFGMGGGDCGPGVAATAELQLPSSLLPTDVLELRERATGLVETLPAADAARAHASDLLCNPDPVTLPARGRMDLQIAVLDATGAEIGSSGWTRAAGQPRGALDARWRRHRRSSIATPDEHAAVSRWIAIAITQPRATRDPGPSGCPHGLEITARAEAAPTGGPWSYEAQSTLTSNGQAAWMGLVDAASATSVLRVGPDGSTTPMASGIAGFPASGGSGARGPYFVTRTHAPNAPAQTALHALGLDARPRWTAPVHADGQYFHLASGGGRVLASWLHRATPLDWRVAWAVYDDSTGAPVGAVTVTSRSAHTNGGLASAFVRDRFLVAWPSDARGSDPSVVLATVSRDGVEMSARDLGVTGHGPMDLASTGARVALVTESDGQIAWHLLDESGALVRGPVVVSAGVGGRDNRKPRVAWNGEVFAVAWETHPSARTYVAVVDEAGRVAPALALQPGVHTCTVGIAATGRELLAAYTQDPYESARAMVAALRCRASAPAGAPQRIQP